MNNKRRPDHVHVMITVTPEFRAATAHLNRSELLEVLGWKHASVRSEARRLGIKRQQRNPPGPPKGK